jgi:hypothetical protein
MQEKVAEFIHAYGLETDIQTRFIDFISEAGDLGKTILFSTDYGTRKAVKNDELSRQAGDTLFALLALFSDLSISDEEVLRDVLSRYEARMKELPEE